MMYGRALCLTLLLFPLCNSFLAAVTGGLVPLPGEWCSRDGRFIEDRVTLGQAGRPIFGKTTFYVVHAWAYKFRDLVSLIEQHYNSLPNDGGWNNVYYWLDVFAVQQNVTGPFTENPDSAFAGGGQ